MTLQDKIQSLGSAVGIAYKRPNSERMVHYQTMLLGNSTAQDYLKIKRNLTDETIKNFGLGYDSEKHAIAIPVYKRGELVNIRYRFIDEDKKPKYIQEKDAEVWLYNEDGIQKGIAKGGVLIVEGEFDLMSAWQAGFKNVVSPASGKDSYGPWLELLDNIPKVFISYDNDTPGKEAALKLAERLGTQKCFEVLYPNEIKDSNDYFKIKTPDEYKELLKSARPFYTYQFKGLIDIIQDMRSNNTKSIIAQHLPGVKLENCRLVVLSGVSNVGKTSYAMNLADELMVQNFPVLVLPFERGTQVVGTRFLQVKYGKTEDEFVGLDPVEWDKISSECINTPLYFAMPTRQECIDTIQKAHRLFNAKFVIIDHIDYIVRATNNKSSEIANMLQDLHRVAEDLDMTIFGISHIRKIQSPGQNVKKKPSMEDLKDSSSLYQDPECVVMLSSDEPGTITVDVVKNKGKMDSTIFTFNKDTGKLGKIYDEFADFRTTGDDKEV